MSLKCFDWSFLKFNAQTRSWLHFAEDEKSLDRACLRHLLEPHFRSNLLQQIHVQPTIQSLDHPRFTRAPVVGLVLLHFCSITMPCVRRIGCKYTRSMRLGWDDNTTLKVSIYVWQLSRFAIYFSDFSSALFTLSSVRLSLRLR